MNPDPCPVCDGLGYEYLADDSTRSCATCVGTGQRPARMVSADHCARLWTDARSYGELCELTALWLEGRLPFTLTNLGPPDDETADIPAGLLAALNRAGYLTDGSQPGHGWIPGWDGAGYRQRAWVDFLVPADRVAPLAWALCQQPRDLWVKVQRIPRWARRFDRNIQWVTEAGEYTPEGAEGVTVAGVAPPRSEWRHLAPNRAVRDIFTSCYLVTAVDLTWGRNDLLWEALAPLTLKEYA